MKSLNLKIVDVFREYLRETKQLLISDIDEFEENINALAPDLMEECFLLVKAIRCGIYDMILFHTYRFINIICSYTAIKIGSTKV